MPRRSTGRDSRVAFRAARLFVGSAWLAAATLLAWPAGAQDGAAAGRRLLDVPYLAQSPALCGGAAAAMILRYWGEPGVTDTEFTHLLDEESGGIRTTALSAALRDRGLEVLEVRGTLERIATEVDAGRPPLLLIDGGGAIPHYVVPVAITPTAVLLHDPALGPFELVARDELVRRWEKGRYWMAIVAPSADHRSRLAEHPSPRDPADSPERIEPTAPLPAAGACQPLLERALDALESGARTTATDTLEMARTVCPTSAPVWRESAAERFTAGDLPAAEQLAAHAASLDPDDAHTWRILATTRYVSGDSAGALQAWNRIGDPIVDLVIAPGLRGLRFPVVQRRAGIAPGALLTADRLALAERRLDDLPGARLSRVGYTPKPDGRADLVLGVVRRPALGMDFPHLARAGWSALTERRVAVEIPGPGGSGELLTATWGFRPGRPHLGLELAAPEPFGVDGIGTAAAEIGSERYAAADGFEVERRRRGAFGLGRWLTPGLHARAAVSVERWSHRPTDLGFTLEVRRVTHDERAALGVSLTGAASTGGAPGYGTLEVGGRWRSSTDPLDAHVLLKGSWAKTSANAPRGLWPRAGTGSTGERLLRAHPLLVDGTIAGEGFGPWMVHGGVEARVYPWRPGPAAIGLAAFVDAARVGAANGPDRTHLDLGAGLRLALAGVDGIMRLDVATGREGEGPVVSLGWQLH